MLTTAVSASPSPRVDPSSEGKEDRILALKKVHMMASASRGVGKGASGKGLKPIKVVIPYTLTWSTDGTGLCAQVANIDPSVNATEWAAWSTLYSEYKVTSVLVRYGVKSRSKMPSYLSTYFFGVGFDPVNSATPAGVRQISELSQHRILAPRLITAGATAADDVYGFTDGLHEFRIKVPNSPMVAGSSVTYVGSVWTSTLAPISVGSLKVFLQSDLVSTNVSVMFLFVTCEFRSRAM
jgi:hypothetical protein